MSPTIGRIVHFFDHTRPRDASGKPGPFAAIITDVHGPAIVTLTVFPVGYPPVSVSSVEMHGGDDDLRIYWTWPPRDGE